ncbi:hypothetical protein SAMN05216337_1001166 [Bradyrhizobium brasilense]|uniref:Uncharacterized protein n=1 Tax=Bradyrhizobium brasilense TaxID=1419277 RepID=A0A1G6IJ66_9BRAD|nr:hypothetical protein [Bradyrhizobium brasilense]SDC06538.1 hypothetical protein SAMN05216337_1001166 [Bradyrhizobium brasilense]
MTSKFAALSGTGKPYRSFANLGGEPVVDKDGKRAYIDMLSEDSPTGRKFDKEWRERVLDLAADGKPAPTDYERNIAKAAALTTGWYLVNPETLEHMDEPCTLENAQELYALADSRWLWAPAWVAANNSANFIKRSAKGSTATQSGTPSEASS